MKAIFNDLYVLINANKGLLALYEKYRDSSLFMALIGYLDLAAASDPNAVKKEMYAFYKRYANRELSEEDWDSRNLRRIICKLVVWADQGKETSEQLVLLFKQEWVICYD